MAYLNQPGKKRAGRLFIPTYCLPSFDKNLLSQVLSIGIIAYPVVDMPVYPVNVHTVKPPEGIAITIYGSAYQFYNIR